MANLGRYRMSMAAHWRPRRMVLLVGLLIVLVGGFTQVMRAQTHDDQGVIASFVSRALSTPASRVSIGQVEGVLSSNTTIRNVAIADDAGVYLTIDRIRLIWRRSALLQRRIEIESLEIGRVTWSRRRSVVSGDVESGPILPELPLKVQIDRLLLAEFVMGEAVIGTTASIGATGSVNLGNPQEGLRARLALRRLDRPGQSDLNLSYVPQGERLELKLRHDEPEGGILARLAGIRGEPPVKLDLDSTGTLDDWAAKFTFTGGSELGADGSARLIRQGQQRELSVTADARIAELLPPVAAPVFSGLTQLTASVAFADTGAVSLQRISIVAQLARLDVDGTVDRDGVLDVRALAQAVPGSEAARGAGERTRIDSTSLKVLVFEASAKGPVRAARIGGKLKLEELQSPQISVRFLQGSFAVIPGDGTLARLEADVTAEGFVPADKAIAAATGPTLSLVARATLLDGIATFQDAHVVTPTSRFDYTGKLGGDIVDGRATAHISNLASFSELTGRHLAGAAQLNALVTGTRPSGDLSRARMRAVLSGQLSKVSVANDAVDKLLAPSVTITGQVALADGRLAFDALDLRSPSLDARLNGQLAANHVALNVTATIANAQILDPRLDGSVRGAFKVTGVTSDPDVALDLNMARGTALGRKVEELVLSAAIRTAVSRPQGALDGSGMIGGKPLVLAGQFASLPGATSGVRSWKLDGFSASVGSVRLDGSGQVDPHGSVDGRFSFAAQDLNDASAIVLRNLGGRVSALVTATSSPTGGQTFVVKADAANLLVDTIRAGRVKLDLTARDVLGNQSITGHAEANALDLGGTRFDKLSFAASTVAGTSTQLVLDGSARGFELAALAHVLPGPMTTIRIDRFRAARGPAVIELKEAATFEYRDGGARTAGLRLGLAAGRGVVPGSITVAGVVGRDLDLKVRGVSVPLAAASAIAPSLDLRGGASFEVALTGPATRPVGLVAFNLRGFSIPAGRNAGAPAVDVDGTARLAGEEARLDTTITSSRGIALKVSGDVPLRINGQLGLTIRGTVDGGLANGQLASRSQRVSGKVVVDASLSGTYAKPEARGFVSLSGASFADSLQGVRLNGIEGRARFDGDKVSIERFAARTAGDGTVALSGKIELDPQNGFPADLKLTGRRAELLNSGLAQLIGNADLTIGGSLAGNPRIAGRIDVLTLNVRVPERLGGASAPLTDARHIAPPPQTRARLKQLARAKPVSLSKNTRRNMPAPIDIIVNAPGRIFVRGRGLDAELGGTLRLTGTLGAPVATGAFDLRRGRLSILTQRLDFIQGRLLFSGSAVPELDFVAETRAADITAKVSVTGPADQPSFVFSSSPALPEDEVLARLLFGRAAGGLSPFQAIQLAQAISQLAGDSTGGGAFDAARRALGVDNLDIDVGAGGPSLGIARAISDSVRIELKAGATPQSTGAGLSIDLTRRLRLQGNIGADGSGSVGVGIEQEY